MDKDREQDKFKSNAHRDSFMPTKGLLFDHWHSTPVKKHTDEGSMARRLANSIHSNSSNQKSSLSGMQRSQIHTSDLELTIIQKQRTELQLLVAELKNREKELNSMVASHHKQLQAWEQDRQKVLSLEHRSTRLEDELHRRNKAIRAVARRLKTSEVREQDSRKELSSVHQQMQELSQRQQYSIQQNQDLEEKNRSLNSNLLSLSSQLGQLQAHEEELNSLIKIKDAVLTETTNRIARLSNQLQESESSLKEFQSHESKRLLEMEEYRGFLQGARQENTQLRDELEEMHLEINSQREELINLRQENHLIRKEMTLADEGDNWREELLSLARSKQERTESELLCLRQVCEHQQNDLQLLKLHLDTTREALMQYESQKSLTSPGDVTCVYVDCSGPSPHMRTVNPGLAEDLVLSIQQQEDFSLSTSCLQRMLAKSQQVIASLEPVMNSEKGCDPICSLSDGHENTKSCEQLQ